MTTEPPSAFALPDWPARPGALQRVGRRLAFAVVVACILAAATLGVSDLWDFAGHETAWRSIATLGVVAAATIAFAAIHEWSEARTAY